jgi:NADH oxidase (H2O2-forming)
MTEDKTHLVIIGNGITGITCARHVRKKSDMQITVVSSETEHFFSRTALMYVYMGHMKYENIKPYENWFWSKNKINLIHGHVNTIDTDSKTLLLDDGLPIVYDKLVIATGSTTNKFGWNGQELPGVQGLYSKPDLDLLEENTKNVNHAVIVGGGLIGIELAEMLHSRGIHVTMLVREEAYWGNILPAEEAAMVGREIIRHGIELRLGIQLKEILPGENGRVRSVVTDKGDEIPCKFVGLTPGVHPNIDLLKDTKIKTGRGVLVNEYLETNVPHVYSAGDCAEIVYPDREKHAVEQLWYTGKMQGEILAKNILGNKTKYERGIWYNSAKFLDIEYQTYGFVGNVPGENEETFYWEDSSGKKCFRAVYSKGSRAITGINVFGIRMRHKKFESWIFTKKTIEYVLEHLKEANFDPEFYKKHEQDIMDKFNRENPGRNLKLKKQKRFFTTYA